MHFGGRFSKVNVAMTSDTVYYIKVRHYNNGKLLSQIHITRNIPTETLTLDGYKDVYTHYGDYAMYKFTPETTGSYVFDVTGYNGGSLNYNTYIKLYENESRTKQIGNDNTKIIAKLTAGHTYY